MADAPKIIGKDTLRTMYPKVNASIDNANEALSTANTAKNTADTAKSTANTALANSENTQTQLDTIVINGDSSVEAAQARVSADGTTYTTLKDRLNNSDVQIAKNESVLGGDLKRIWLPPTQPSSDQIIPRSNNNPADYINLWEGLRTAFPDYITRELLGEEITGNHNIYKYVFTPMNYEKTVIISANVHGWETEGQRILYRLMYHICYDHDKYSQLSYARNKVRFVLIPLLNPRGLYLGTRYNGNNVDINRNFNYGWQEYVSTSNTYKGTAPLSEKESQYLDAVLSQYSSEDAVAHIDIHNTPEITQVVNTAEYYCPVPEYGNSARNYLHDVIELIAPKGYTIKKNIEHNVSPIAPNQSAHLYGLHSCSVEWQPGAVYGASAYSGSDVREGLKFIGNVILQLCAKQLPKADSLSEPWVVELNNDRTSGFSTTLIDTYEDVPQMKFTFKPKVDGILIVNGNLSYHNTDVASQNWLTLLVQQSSNKGISDGSTSTLQRTHEVYNEPNGKRSLLNVSNMCAVHATDYQYGEVTVKLQWKTSSGVMNHRRSNLYISFIPSDKGTRHEKYNVSTEGVLYKSFPADYSM